MHFRNTDRSQQDRLPTFEILCPTTTGDKGVPSLSILKDAERVFAFIQDERHLVAHALYLDVKRRLEEWQQLSPPKKRSSYLSSSTTSNGNNGQHHHHQKRSRLSYRSTRSTTSTQQDEDSTSSHPDLEFQKAQSLLKSNQREVETLENRCRLFRQAQRSLALDEDWIFASRHLGIQTYYRREPSDGSLSIKLEGTLDHVPLFEQLCVLKEVDLHYTWAPFCSSSMTIANLDKLDQVGWFLVGMPHFGLARDGCFRAIGCDCMEEDGTMLLTAQGIQDEHIVPPNMPTITTASSSVSRDEDRYLGDDSVIQQLDIPPVPKRRGIGRMTIHKLDAMVHILSPVSASTCIVANINPNISFMPQSLLDFIMKHMAGVMVGKLQTAARKIAKNPKTNVHAKRMRAESKFYKDWLLVKFEAFCREKGWEMPPVTVFDVEDEPRFARIGGGGREVNKALSRTYSGIMTVNSPNAFFENLSAIISSPGDLFMQHHQQPADDDVSELSSHSGMTSGVWRNNPIVQYLREMEHRTEAKKAAKVAEARRRAAERLKPKELSFEKQERLQELKTALAARRRQVDDDDDDGSGTTSSDADSPKNDVSTGGSGRSRLRSQTVTPWLYSHNPITQVLVIVFLVALLFAMLHPVVFLKLPLLVSSLPVAWWQKRCVEDALTIIYILFCSMVHYVLCEVALVYAFSSLDLGMKSGRQVKLFYSANVHTAMACCSLSIVTVSIVKAAAKVWARAVLWGTFQMTSTLKRELERCLSLSPSMNSPLLSASIEPVLNGFAFVRSTAISGIEWSSQLVHQLVQSLLSNAIRSNFVGREIEHIFTKFFSLFAMLLAQSNAFVQESIDGYESLASWREEAFETTRVLFAYSSVFLLTFLVLFHASGRRARTPVSVTRSPRHPTDTRPDIELSNLHFASFDEELSGDALSTRPRTGTACDTIPEHEEVHQNNAPPGSGCEGVSVVIDDGTSSRKWPGQQQALRRRAWSGPEGRGHHKSESF